MMTNPKVFLLFLILLSYSGGHFTVHDDIYDPQGNQPERGWLLGDQALEFPLRIGVGVLTWETDGEGRRGEGPVGTLSLAAQLRRVVPGRRRSVGTVPAAVTQLDWDVRAFPGLRSYLQTFSSQGSPSGIPPAPSVATREFLGQLSKEHFGDSPVVWITHGPTGCWDTWEGPGDWLVIDVGGVVPRGDHREALGALGTFDLPIANFGETERESLVVARILSAVRTVWAPDLRWLPGNFMGNNAESVGARWVLPLVVLHSGGSVAVETAAVRQTSRQVAEAVGGPTGPNGVLVRPLRHSLSSHPELAVAVAAAERSVSQLGAQGVLPPRRVIDPAALRVALQSAGSLAGLVPTAPDVPGPRVFPILLLDLKDVFFPEGPMAVWEDALVGLLHTNQTLLGVAGNEPDGRFSAAARLFGHEALTPTAALGEALLGALGGLRGPTHWWSPRGSRAVEDFTWRVSPWHSWDESLSSVWTNALLRSSVENSAAMALHHFREALEPLRTFVTSNFPPLWAMERTDRVESVTPHHSDETTWQGWLQRTDVNTVISPVAAATLSQLSQEIRRIDSQFQTILDLVRQKK